MAIFSGPEITNNGLVLHLDAANYRSKSYNVISNSENLSSLLSLRAGAVVASNSTTAPDGTQTADLITGTGSGFGYYFPAWPTGTATHSWFLKPNGATTTFNFSHAGTGWGGTFNFSTKQFSSLSNYSGSYEEFPNGWYLVSLHTTNESNNYYAELSFNSNDGAYIWGVQLTPFSYYRPYISQSAGAISSTVWRDLSSNGRTGTLFNGVSYNSPGTISFDGIDDYSEINTALTNSFTEFTAEIVFRTPVAGNSGTAFLLWDHSAGGAVWLGKSQGNQWYWFWNYAGARAKSAQISSTSYTANSWIHIAVRSYMSNTVRISETNNFAEMIVNGTNYSTAHRNDSDLTLSYPSGNIWLARKGTAAGNGELGATVSNYSTAEISFFKVYNRVLSRAEILQNFEAIRGRYGI